MEKDEIVSSQFITEMTGARLERSNKRSFILNVILVLILFVTFLGVIYREHQFQSETITIEAEQEASDNSDNYIVGGDYAFSLESQDN